MSVFAWAVRRPKIFADKAPELPRKHAARHAWLGWLALLLAPAVSAQSPNLAQQNCNKIWGINTVGTATSFFNVDPVTLASGPILATGPANSRGAALAIDGSTGYLYVAGDDGVVSRYNGSSGAATTVATIPGGSSANRYARGTVVNNVLLVMRSAGTAVASNVSFIAHRFSINPASGNLTAMPDATVTVPVPSGFTAAAMTGGDLAQDDTTDRTFMLVNGLVGANYTPIFYELPSGIFSVVTTAVIGTPLNGSPYTSATATTNFGSFSIFRSQFYIGSGGGTYRSIPTDIGNNPATVTLQAGNSSTNGQTGASDFASCGIPAFTTVKTAQARDPDGNAVAYAVEGGSIDYTVVVRNVGSTVIGGSSFTDLLPTGTSYVANSATLNGTNLGSTATNPFNPGREIHSVGRAAGSMGYVLPNNTATMTYRVNVNTVTGPVINTATSRFTDPITSPAPDCTSANEAYCDSVTVPVGAKLTLNKTVGGRVDAADQFSVRIRNGGTDLATAATAGTGTTAGTGAVSVALGSTYTFDEVMAAGSVAPLAGYATGIACTNVGGNAATVLPSGNGQSFSVTPAAGDDIVCNLTNVRQTQQLNLAKTWANPGAGHTASAITTGTVNSASFNSAAPGPSSGTAVAMTAGESLTLPAETFGGGATAAEYTATVTCAGGTVLAASAPPQTVTIGNSATATVCTYSNTRVSKTLTLRKQWSGATVGDDASLTVTRAGSEIDRLDSDAGSAGELDTDATPTVVFAGESLNLAETLAAGNAGRYNSVLACTGGGTVAGSVVSVDATATAVVCTYANTALSADLSVSKTNTPLAGPGDQPGDTAVRGAATSYTLLVRNAGPDAADGTMLRDPSPIGLTCTTASCGNATGGAVCPSAGTLTVAALQSAGGVAIPVLPANSQLTVTLGCTVQ